MWPMKAKPSKGWLQGIKALTINGHRFTIKKVNPLADFSSDRMPQIFASSYAQVKKLPAQSEKPFMEQARHLRQDMIAMVEAGLVEPELVPVGTGEQRGKEAGITINDIARDEQLLVKLYWEIWLHSLDKFRGLRSFFFRLRARYWLWTTLRVATGESRPMSAGLMAGFP